MDRLNQGFIDTQRALADLKTENQQLAGKTEILEREFFNERYCRSGKNSEFNASIIKFIRDVEKGMPGACSQAGTQDALYALGTQAYNRSFFRPTEKPTDIRKARKGHLLTSILDPKWFHPSTKLLILLMQPVEETAPAQTLALSFGEEWQQYLLGLAKGRELRFVGTGVYLLPCRLSKEVERRYNGPLDVPVEGEPSEGAPHICAWTIRTDCG